MTNHFCVTVFFEYLCDMDHESDAKEILYFYIKTLIKYLLITTFQELSVSFYIFLKNNCNL